MSQQGQVIFNQRYELYHRLGRGGMAEVYLARDQLLDRPVAVKVLFPTLATEAGFVERFRREAQSAANLQHPNIVSVFDWGEANGTYFIVMEYVDGQSLAEILREHGRVHPDRAAEVAGDVAGALGFAHRNGVVHRDVKPGNVLIASDGAVKVADFGIARALTDSSDHNLTKTGSVMGTATYFSPEQARGAQIDPRSDIYSLGCVIYELTTGHPPFQGDGPMAIAYKHVQEAPVPPRQIDPALPETLEAITLKCLAKNPDNRYPSALDLRADLGRYLDGARIMAEPVMAPPVDQSPTGFMAPTAYDGTAVAQPAAWDDYDDYGDYEDEQPKRSKWPLVLLLLLLLALAGLLFFLATSASNGSEQVEVPNVVGQQVTQAEQALETEGFEVATAMEASDEPVDTVIDQDPPPNTEADEGSTVNLTVSAGPDTVAVPDVVNLTREEAEATLREEGFTPLATREESDEVEEGRVISQDPPGGQEVAPESTVTIVVSSGESTVPVPEVAGRSESEATAILSDAGFNVERADEGSNDVPEGTVIRSQPGAGSEVEPGSTVTIFVSSGPDLVAVPNAVGLTEENARGQLEGAGFQVQVTKQPTADPGQDGIVLSQNPTANSEAQPGSTVSLVVQEFREPEPGPPLPGVGDGDGDGEDGGN